MESKTSVENGETMKTMDTKKSDVIKADMVKRGYDDYVDSIDGTPNLSNLQAVADYHKIERSILESWYMEGWNAATEAAREQGTALFLLCELAKSLEHASECGYEWYGSDFESPLNLVNKAIKAFKDKQ